MDCESNLDIRAVKEKETYKPPVINTNPTAIFCAHLNRSGHNSHSGRSRITTSVAAFSAALARNAAYKSMHVPSAPSQSLWIGLQRYRKLNPAFRE